MANVTNRALINKKLGAKAQIVTWYRYIFELGKFRAQSFGKLQKEMWGLDGKSI